MEDKRLIGRKEYEQFVAGLPKDYCPFCDPGKQILLGDFGYWSWVACLSPYWRYHTLLVPKRHIVRISDVSPDEFSELKEAYSKITKHLLSLGLKHDDGKAMDQFILIIRDRHEDIEGGSTYYKPNHLHIHLAPDKEGVARIILDDSAIESDMDRISLLKK